VLVAFVIGVTALRPSALRIGALGAELAQATPDRRETLGAEIGRLREKALPFRGGRAQAPSAGCRRPDDQLAHGP